MQVGAFHSESSAASVFAQVKTLGNGGISSFLKAGQTLHRAIRTVQTVSEADKLLDGVMNIGFPGARIIVD